MVLANGYRVVGTWYWVVVLGTVYTVQGMGYWLLRSGVWVLGILQHMVLGTGSWVLGIGYWVRGIRHWVIWYASLFGS